MKMHEIITVSRDHPFADYPEEDIAATLEIFKGARSISLPHSLVVKIKKVGDLKWLGIFKRDELVGWIKLQPTKVHGAKYHTVDLIYVMPKFRKTPVVGWMLIYGKDLVGTPFILGDMAGHGGVVFKDGADLIARLAQSDKFDVSVMDLRTGEKMPYTEPSSARHTTDRKRVV